MKYLPTSGSNNSDDFWFDLISVPQDSKKCKTMDAFETFGGNRMIFCILKQRISVLLLVNRLLVKSKYIAASK